MIKGIPPGANGIVASTFDHAGGLPAIERIIRETGHAGRYRHSGAGRRSDLATVQITLAGAGRAWPGGIDASPGQPVPRGRCLAFRYGQPVAYAVDQYAGSWDFIYVNLVGSAAHDMLEELISRHGHILACDPAHPDLVRLADLAAGGSATRHRQLALADSAHIACGVLLALVEANQHPAAPKQDPLEGACAYLIRRITTPVDVADAAAAVDVSREHLTRLFRRRLGLAPAAWLRRERLRRAEVLLRGGDLPLAVVAQRSGFATASHFVHAFRRQHGMTPGRWRTGADSLMA